MANNSTPDKTKPTNPAKAATNAATPSKSNPATKVVAKPTLKPPTKPGVKPAAKRLVKAPTKTATKPVSKAAPDQEAPKKGRGTKADKNAKLKKAKLVRDSFTMPEPEYDLLAEVKRRCIAKGLAVKKSEVLRAAIIGFAAQSDAAVMAALRTLEVIKTGRPPIGQK